MYLNNKNKKAHNNFQKLTVKWPAMKVKLS